MRMLLCVGERISVNVRPNFSPFRQRVTWLTSMPSRSKKPCTKSPNASSEILARKPTRRPRRAMPTAMFAGEPPRYLLKCSLCESGRL